MQLQCISWPCFVDLRLQAFFLYSILDLPLAVIFHMRARRFRLLGALVLCAFLASEIAFLGFPRRFKLFQFDQFLSRKNLSTARCVQMQAVEISRCPFCKRRFKDRRGTGDFETLWLARVVFSLPGLG